MSQLPWDMTGKIVVITGGNAGIDFGLARGIARTGGGYRDLGPPQGEERRDRGRGAAH